MTVAKSAGRGKHALYKKLAGSLLVCVTHTWLCRIPSKIVLAQFFAFFPLIFEQKRDYLQSLLEHGRFLITTCTFLPSNHFWKLYLKLMLNIVFN